MNNFSPLFVFRSWEKWNDLNIQPPTSLVRKTQISKVEAAQYLLFTEYPGSSVKTLKCLMFDKKKMTCRDVFCVNICCIYNCFPLLQSVAQNRQINKSIIQKLHPSCVCFFETRNSIRLLNNKNVFSSLDGRIKIWRGSFSKIHINSWIKGCQVGIKKSGEKMNF